MPDVNEKMDIAVESDDFNKIESIATNPKNALVRVGCLNIFTGKHHYENRWTDISEVGKEYFESLSGDCQDYVMQLDEYKKLDYDKLVETYDNKVEQYELKKGTHISQFLKNK
jgi:hypothetical protein